MDVIYPYKRVGDEFELRYSLRSLVNAPHDRVIVAGDKPRLLSDGAFWAGVVPLPDRFKSSTANIVEAVQQGGVTGDVIVMNDDIFVLEPWSFRHEHRGTIEAYLASGAASGGYWRRAESTLDILRGEGVAEPLFFGLHTPTVYDSAKLVDVVKKFEGRNYLLRTLYHNLFPQPAVESDDVKVRRWSHEQEGSVLSISDQVGLDPRFRAWIEGKFPEPSPYEKADVKSERKAA